MGEEGRFSINSRKIKKKYLEEKNYEFSYVYLPFQQAAQQFLMMPDRIQSIMDEAVGCINDELESVIQ